MEIQRNRIANLAETEIQRNRIQKVANVGPIRRLLSAKILDRPPALFQFGALISICLL